ncbi:MAG: endonuclease III [Planctomycetaceae bacterium]|jgi:endonuclease-3|nr:endonuclease III [Planctomycetaceae bacterium]
MPTDKKYAAKVLRRLKKKYTEARCALHYENPLQILVATILSAQCTDVRVNIVTKDLFQKYRSARDFAAANLNELENDIRTTGFFHNKAKNIKAACEILEQTYHGEVPADMEKLIQLPGVGRKTANCVLGNGFGIAVGVVVDTHVERLSHRIGLSESNTPEKIERDLMPLFPKSEWIGISHRLIFHGRETCSARKPCCEDCLLNDICPRIGVQ